MSSSPSRQRQFRSSRRRPASVRYAAAMRSPRAPRSLVVADTRRPSPSEASGRSTLVKLWTDDSRAARLWTGSTTVRLPSAHVCRDGRADQRPGHLSGQRPAALRRRRQPPADRRVRPLLPRGLADDEAPDRRARLRRLGRRGLRCHRPGARPGLRRRLTVILVVGATGQLGSLIVRELGRQGRPVRAIVRPPDAGRDLAEAGAELVTADLLRPDTLDDALRGVRAVIATANVIVPTRRGDTHQGLARGYADLIERAKAAGVERFVYASVPETPLDD